MNLNNWKIIFFTATILILLSLYSPIIVENLPKPQEETYLTLSILGEKGVADDYFPDDDNNINTNMSIKWQLYIYNHRGISQLIKVKIKLSDSKTPLPDLSTCTSSSADEIYEIRKVLQNNETLIIPFNWEISEISENDEVYNISRIRINGNTRSINFNVLPDEIIKMICELWVYDPYNNEFTFDWIDLGETRCIWNQIQFRIVL